MSKRTTAVGKVLERGLEVGQEEVDAFPFDHRDLKFVQLSLLVEPPKSYAEYAAELGLSESALRQRLLDKTRCAWIARQLDKAVSTRMGLVHAAVFQAAIRTGDYNRARYLDQLTGVTKETPGQLHLHQHNHSTIDLSALSVEELKKYISAKSRELRGVIDVEAEEIDRSEPD